MEEKSMEGLGNEDVITGSEDVEFGVREHDVNKSIWRIGYYHRLAICKRNQRKVANVRNVFGR
jgi:hypothetical protein